MSELSIGLISFYLPILESLRGSYLAVGIQCWMIAYFVGSSPILGLIILAVFESMTSDMIEQSQPSET